MATTEIAAIDAIHAQITAAWNAEAGALNGGTVPRMYYENLDDDPGPNVTPDITGPFARVVARHLEAPQVGFGASGVGSGKFQTSGLVVVQVYTAKGKGRTLSDQLVKIIIDALRGEHATTDSSVWFRDVVQDEVGVLDEAPWFQQNAQATFTYDINK